VLEDRNFASSPVEISNKMCCRVNLYSYTNRNLFT
jgi:hypothetical protein